MADILVVRPRYDNPTRVSFGWADAAIDQALRLGHAVHDLPDDQAVRRNVERSLADDNISLVLFYGHGLHRSLTGNDRRPCIDFANASALSEKITYAIACKSGNMLMIEIGSQFRAAYIGYTVNFPVADNPTYQLPFLTAATSVVTELLQGSTVEAAVAKGRSNFSILSDDLEEMGDSESEAFAALAAECREGLNYLGAKYARLRR